MNFEVSQVPPKRQSVCFSHVWKFRDMEVTIGRIEIKTRFIGGEDCMLAGIYDTCIFYEISIFCLLALVLFKD